VIELDLAFAQIVPNFSSRYPPGNHLQNHREHVIYHQGFDEQALIVCPQVFVKNSNRQVVQLGVEGEKESADFFAES
jgi:hypothetical protein